LLQCCGNVSLKNIALKCYCHENEPLNGFKKNCHDLFVQDLFFKTFFVQSFFLLKNTIFHPFCQHVFGISVVGLHHVHHGVKTIPLSSRFKITRIMMNEPLNFE